MELVGLTQQHLDALAGVEYPSPEDFLSTLEEQLESGEITIEEAMLIMADYGRTRA